MNIKLFSFLTCLTLISALGEAADIKQDIEQDYPQLERLYQHLHQNPELSFQEEKTAAKIAKEMESIGFEVTPNFGGHGIVAMLKNGVGPTLLIRTDLDALPIEEKTGLSYASKTISPDRDGKPTHVMHACGHDIHMTVFVGTAKRLFAMRSQWQGTLIMIGQPAEERSGGAKAMLAEGLFEKYPRPDYNLALHVSSNLPAGSLGAVSGYAMANVDSVDILVNGQGGHGAYPNKAKDPVVIASQIVLALQTIVSREISPLQPAVVTVGSIHGGKQHNIIPDQVKLQLTLRSYDDGVREHTINAIKRISRNIALAAGIPENKLPKVTVLDEYTPAAYNNPELTQQLIPVLKKVAADRGWYDLTPEMVGEDFGRYGAVEPKIPSLMFRLGTIDMEKIEDAKRNNTLLPGLHSAYFAPIPEPTIKSGVEAMTRISLKLLAERREK